MAVRSQNYSAQFPIPASAQELYTTGVDNQTGIDIHVLQGERELAKDCRSLARFTLRVQPAPAGLPRIEVKFLIDANGILQVGAKDLRTGEQHSLEVQPSYGINDSEIERMLEDPSNTPNRILPSARSSKRAPNPNRSCRPPPKRWPIRNPPASPPKSALD